MSLQTRTNPSTDFNNYENESLIEYNDLSEKDDLRR